MSEKTKDRPEDQRMPVASDSPPMHDVAAMLLESRKQLGIKRYGKALQAFNGRDAVQDVLEEALDSAAYAAQLAWEQSHPEETYVGVLIETLWKYYWIADDGAQVFTEFDFTGKFVPDAVVRLLESKGFTVTRDGE